MSLQCNVRHESGRCRSSQRLPAIPRLIGLERHTPAKDMLSAMLAGRGEVELLTQEDIIDQSRCIKKLQTRRGGHKVTAAPDLVVLRLVGRAVHVVARSGLKKEQQVVREKRNVKVRSGPPREQRPTQAPRRASLGWPGLLTNPGVDRFGPPGRLALRLPLGERLCGPLALQLPHQRQVRIEPAKLDGAPRGNCQIMIFHQAVRTT